jgi:hypothetical protein
VYGLKESPLQQIETSRVGTLPGEMQRREQRKVGKCALQEEMNLLAHGMWAHGLLKVWTT